MPADKDAVVAVISDMQVGSTVGLCPPRWQLHDGGTHRASPAQMIIYRQWVKSSERVRDLLTEGRGKKRLVLVLNGEPIDNHHHDTPQIITRNATEQIDMAISLLDEWLGIVDYAPKRGDCIYLVRGTSAHEKGEHIERIGRDIDGVIPMRKDSSPLVKDGRYHFQKLRRTINGQYFHITHHGMNRGSRAWTSENGINNACKSIYFSCLDSGSQIPNFIIRSHNHVWTEGGYDGRNAKIFGCITPCWQLKSHFGNQVAANDDINTIGMVSFDVLKSGATKVYPEYIEVEDSPIKEF